MKAHHTLVPVIASLALFAPNPASALTPVWKALKGTAIEELRGNVVEVKVSKWFYHCNNMMGGHARQRCYQMHGLNYKGQRVKSGL